MNKFGPREFLEFLIQSQKLRVGKRVNSDISSDCASLCVFVCAGGGSLQTHSYLFNSLLEAMSDFRCFSVRWLSLGRKGCGV